MLRQVQKRSRTTQAALVGNGMAWFGAAVFLLGLGGEHGGVLAAGPWPHVVGAALLIAVGVGLVVGGVLDNRRIRNGHPRTH